MAPRASPIGRLRLVTIPPRARFVDLGAAQRRTTTKRRDPSPWVIVNIEGTADDANLDQLCTRLDREEKFLHYHIRSSGPHIAKQLAIYITTCNTTERIQFNGSDEKSDTGEDTQIFSRMVTVHCTRHAGPEGDSPKTPKISELRVLTTPPVVGHDSGGGSQ